MPRIKSGCSALATEFPLSSARVALAQDNLNTHHGGSFYKWLEPEAARQAVSRFEWVYTPKHASWLNMAEIEFSALQRQCLNRRIPTVERLADEVEAWVGARDTARLKLHWQFSVQDARLSFGRQYQSIRNN